MVEEESENWNATKQKMFSLALIAFQIKEMKGVFLPEDARAHVFGKESQYPSTLRSKNPFLFPYYSGSIPVHLTNIRNERQS